jgi:hypothetical protein
MRWESSVRKQLMGESEMGVAGGGGGVGFRKEEGFDLELRRNMKACRGT